MDLWLWSLYFLPVSGALRTLPEVKLEGELGGSITIMCPLPELRERVYLCRMVVTSGVCSTVVSNMNFVKEEYRSRVTLQQYPDKNLFLVEVTELTESDSGVYACGAGKNTDRDKTQQVILSVNSEYNPFLEEMLEPEPSRWFPRLLQLPMAFTTLWPHVPADATPEFISKVTTPAQRTQTPPAHPPSPTSPITHHPQVASVSSVTAAKPPTLLPSTTASKTSAQVELLRLRTASYNHHTRLHRQRAFNHGLSGRTEDQGFHILIPAILGLILLALLGMMIKRSIRRRKAFSRRVRRLAVRMRALEASQRRLSQRPRMSQRPRSQNIYSACPRRARGADAAGEQEVPRPGPGATEASAGLQVSSFPRLIGGRDGNGSPTPGRSLLKSSYSSCILAGGRGRSQQLLGPEPGEQVVSVSSLDDVVSGTLWLPGSWEALKTSCEYMSYDHQPPSKLGDADSEDYINIPYLTHLPTCPPRPGSLCQGASSVC